MRPGRMVRAAAGLALAGSLAGCVMVDLSTLFSHNLQEVTLEDADGFVRNKILLVDLGGLIAPKAGSGPFSRWTVTPDYIRAVLEKAGDDARVRALLLRIDSPGGGVTATDMITHEIRTFAEKKKIPVYAHILNVGASGGYYAATAADRIHAEPTAVTGSIGVLLALPKFKELAEKVGYEHVVIKSGKMKDLGNAFRDMNEEEREIFQTLLGNLYNRFLDTIVARRPAFTSREQIQALADGRIYTADQALAHGLIDKVTHLDQTLEDLRRAAGIQKADVVTYAYTRQPDANVYSPAAAHPRTPFSLDLTLPGSVGRAGFYYLWSAGE